MFSLELTKSVVSERREDIDLLRAIAVLAVLFFHLDLHWMQSGFLGVDVFFVISGYLITGSILSQMRLGKFSLLKFYSRRVRRLVPALYVMLAATSIGVVFLLPSSLLPDFNWSMITSATYVSNIYFYLESGYFDLEAVGKPLLHTWSLSVEEQFYLLWPTFIVLCFGRGLPAALIVVGLVSLTAAQMMLSVSESAAFYIFPFRIFEFAAGALCIYSKTSPLNNKLLRYPTLLLAFGAIFWSVIALEPNTPMPGVWSLPIVIGTATIILLRPNLNRLPRYLRWPILYVGLISYSIYLVHWPLITLYKFSTGWELETEEIIVLLLATLVSASLLYHLVEFRWHYSASALSDRMSLSLIPLGIASSVIIVLLMPQARAFLPGEAESIKKLIEPISGFRDQTVIPTTRSVDYDRASGPDKTILVIGDSLSEDVMYALWKNLEPEWSFTMMNHPCHPIYIDSDDSYYDALYQDFADMVEIGEAKCVPYHKWFIENIKTRNPSHIVFSERWYLNALEYLPSTLAAIKEQVGAQVLLLGRNIELREVPQIFLNRIDRTEDINVVATHEQVDDREGLSNAEYDQLMAEIADRAGVFFLSKTDIVCPNLYCDIYYDGAITYVDGNHWSLPGMDLFGRRLVQSETFRTFVRNKQDGWP